MHRHHFDEPHAFALNPDARPTWAADRPVRAEHVRIEVELDFEKSAIKGKTTTTVRVARNLKSVTFDAESLDVDRVDVDGTEVTFENDGKHLHVNLKKALKKGARADIVIRYRARPTRGLYFQAPDKGYPNRPVQAWTQGQDEDSRCWFPCFDSPAQKATTEVIATVPEHMRVLSNGRLESDVVKKGKRVVHHAMTLPHSPYLVTLVAGEFEEHVASADGTKVVTLFPKGQKAEALNCAARTPQMVRFFEELTGHKYPWGSTYAQIFVTEFIFGGMENTGATTLTDAVLHDDRAHADYSAEPLISHELAHQWFGDLLTCRDWPHGWLNEGFATYSETLWKEHADGQDEADQARRANLLSYLDEANDSYQRPIVTRKFDEPIDLFDSHLYEKGGLVLHELRRRLGEEDFKEVVRAYVERHAHSAVETVDLARVVEDVTGRNFDRFFDQYVFKAGHPSLKAELRFDAERKQLKITLKQTQKSDEPYYLPISVRVVHGDKFVDHTWDLTEKEHVFSVKSDKSPDFVIVDGRRDILGTLEVDMPIAWSRHALKSAPWARARTEVAAALGKDGSPASIDALEKAVKDEKQFWATRAAAARALAAIRTPRAKAALLGALTIKHPKARRAVVSALGDFRNDEEVATALGKLLDAGDASYFVEADACRAVGKVRGKGALKLLTSMTAKKSFMDVILAGALDGLSDLQDDAAWKVVVPFTQYGAPTYARRSALLAVAKLAETANKKREAVELIADALRDPQFRTMMAAFDAAQALGDNRILGALASTPFGDGRARRSAKEAAKAIRSNQTQSKEVTALRTELEKLKTELKALSEKVKK